MKYMRMLVLFLHMGGFLYNSAWDPEGQQQKPYGETVLLLPALQSPD